MISFGTDPTVSFNQSAYSVAEDNGPARPLLVLSNPSSLDITVQVLDNSVTATRKLSTMHIIMNLLQHVISSVTILHVPCKNDLCLELKFHNCLTCHSCRSLLVSGQMIQLRMYIQFNTNSESIRNYVHM